MTIHVYAWGCVMLYKHNYSHSMFDNYYNYLRNDFSSATKESNHQNE